jgi:hypothetical protein
MPALKLTPEQVADYRRITDAARAQALEAVQTAEVAPMEWGHLVAWAECRVGRTDGLSVVHRVASWSVDDARTICGDQVPPAMLRVALTSGLVRTLGRCRYCESAYVQKGNAA